MDGVRVVCRWTLHLLEAYATHKRGQVRRFLLRVFFCCITVPIAQHSNTGSESCSVTPEVTCGQQRDEQ